MVVVISVNGIMDNFSFLSFAYLYVFILFTIRHISYQHTHTHCDLGIGMALFNNTLETQPVKEKIDQLLSIETEICCSKTSIK